MLTWKSQALQENAIPTLWPWVYGTLSSHEFEREQGELYVRDWREEMEGGNNIIILVKEIRK